MSILTFPTAATPMLAVSPRMRALGHPSVAAIDATTANVNGYGADCARKRAVAVSTRIGFEQGSPPRGVPR